MIVKYNEREYRFYKDDVLIHSMYDHPEDLKTVKFRNNNLVFPQVLGAISLIDIHTVAHRELKHWLATVIMREQQRQIDELANIVKRIQLERIRH